MGVPDPGTPRKRARLALALAVAGALVLASLGHGAPPKGDGHSGGLLGLGTRLEAGLREVARARRSDRPAVAPTLHAGCGELACLGRVFPPRGPERPVRCTRNGPVLERHGPTRGRRVALTFDDGPGLYTGRILRTLERLRARATFFLVGRQVAGRARLVREELAGGNELGNHTWNHSSADAHGELGFTSALIRRVTGFEPCLFRAPYGDERRVLVRNARRLGMTTVGWDVDPRDWARPGAAEIAKRVVGAAHPGAIVVMHDGGGVRAETAAALPRIIRGLRRRGYRLATVSELLAPAKR